MSRPNRSDSDSSDPGAAQFISNLSPRQLQHLQFAVPKQGEPERFSQFLEEPRQVPVPKRFTFDALDVEARKARKETTKAKEIGKHARKDSAKSRRSETSKSDTSAGSSSRGSVDVLKEVERVSSVVDWRFYLTGACICLLNLVAAWDVTTLSTALPVSSPSKFIIKARRTNVYVDYCDSTSRLGSRLLLAGRVFLGCCDMFSAALRSIQRHLWSKADPSCSLDLFHCRLVHLGCNWNVHRLASRPKHSRYGCWRLILFIEPRHFGFDISSR